MRTFLAVLAVWGILCAALAVVWVTWASAVKARDRKRQREDGGRP